MYAIRSYYALAAAVAVELAHRGLPVHLTTSDPAAHLTETLDGSLDNLSVSRVITSYSIHYTKLYDSSFNCSSR